MCGRRADTRAHFRVCESGKIYLGRGMRVSELGRPGRGHTVVSSRCVAAARLGRGAPQTTKISHVAWAVFAQFDAFTPGSGRCEDFATRCLHARLRWRRRTWRASRTQHAEKKCRINCGQHQFCSLTSSQRPCAVGARHLVYVGSTATAHWNTAIVLRQTCLRARRATATSLSLKGCIISSVL